MEFGVRPDDGCDYLVVVQVGGRRGRGQVEWRQKLQRQQWRWSSGGSDGGAVLQ